MPKIRFCRRCEKDKPAHHFYAYKPTRCRKCIHYAAKRRKEDREILEYRRMHEAFII